MPAPQHANKETRHVSCAVLTVSDTRTPDTDTGGQFIINALKQADHELYAYEIVPDDCPTVQRKVRSFCDDADCRAVLITGGTGIAPRDNTYEAVAELLHKRLDGFGELFRMLSYEQVGAAAMLSRAVAGTRDRTVIFAMPGSPKAVELAMTRLIAPELGHMVHLLDSQ